MTVTAENLHEYIAGICIGNDVSARDIQIPQMQFYKGKSYRTFCPLGPVLCLLSKAKTNVQPKPEYC
ncbi:fumarylacetoacetate hydrolase family protein [Acinetobacter bereziniae]|uniref:fumarylacetoacetate hydrolase family protein n=1 Tax=Acinetobacter bereziniae TaxID=106648 RepID=UPI003AF5498F